MNDPETEGIAYDWRDRWKTMSGLLPVGLKKPETKKPVVGLLLVRRHLPEGACYAGAIIGGAEDTAAAKMKIMRELMRYSLLNHQLWLVRQW